MTILNISRCLLCMIVMLTTISYGSEQPLSADSIMSQMNELDRQVQEKYGNALARTITESDEEILMCLYDDVLSYKKMLEQADEQIAQLLSLGFESNQDSLAMQQMFAMYLVKVSVLFSKINEMAVDQKQSTVTEQSPTSVINNDSDMDTCGICLDKYQICVMVTPGNCQHRFCKDCLLNYACVKRDVNYKDLEDPVSKKQIISDVCPICRRKIDMKKIKDQLNGFKS